MSPVHEIEVQQLPKEIAQTLSKKDRARLFNNGGGFLVDPRENGWIRFNYPSLSEEIISSCKESAYKHLFVVRPAFKPEERREELVNFYGDNSSDKPELRDGYMPHTAYRGKHRSDNRGSGIRAFFRITGKHRSG